MLYFVGLGIRGAQGISIDARDILTKCDLVYLERFTSPVGDDEARNLSDLIGKSVLPVRRWFIEDGREILASSASKSVAIVSCGDPMIATTHSELRTRAHKHGIPTRILSAASGLTALIGESGLHYYKFGRSATVMSEPMSATSVYNVIHSNLLTASHTLILTEYREGNEGEPNFFMDPAFAMKLLSEAERDFRLGAFCDDTFIIVASRAGLKGQSLVSGSVKDLTSREYGSGPHSIIVTGKLHFTEEESVASLTNCVSQPSDNSTRVSRIAVQMMRKYIPKAYNAIKSLRESTGSETKSPIMTPGDLSVLENADYYLQDAEKFEREGRLELAVLSVGYAEGLIDAIRFQKGMNPWA